MSASEQQQEHPRSYYSATVNERTDYPVLRGNHSTDICVVGAGFTGIATALTLAERGYSVAVIEANRVGWGASGRNGGQLIGGLSGLGKIKKKYGPAIAETIWRMRWRGNEIIRERVARYGIECDLKDGYVEVARKPRQIQEIEDEAEERAEHGWQHRYEVWDRNKVRERLGTDAFYGGFACYQNGHLHPLNLCIGEAAAAAGCGVQIFEQSPVMDIAHGRRPKVRTPDGAVEADAVVLAGNAYILLENRHLGNLVFPAQSYMIATEPLEQRVAAAINRDDFAVCDLNHVVDYYRLSADKRLLYGGACNYSGRNPGSIKSYILPRMLRIYPRLRNVGIDFEWGGTMGIVLRRIPVLGRINRNVYYCMGYSGHGVSGTHLMGEVMADAVTGTMERFDLFAGMRQIRLPGSRWIGNQIIALGMMYYKLRDML